MARINVSNTDISILEGWLFISTDTSFTALRLDHIVSLNLDKRSANNILLDVVGLDGVAHSCRCADIEIAERLINNITS